MPISAILHLKAAQPGVIAEFSGIGVHGFWFNRWRQVDPALAEVIHPDNQEPRFTLSPLMGLPSPVRRVIHVPDGQTSWLRVTLLDESLEEVFYTQWLEGLLDEPVIEIPKPRLAEGRRSPGVSWKVIGTALQNDQHPSAKQESYQALRSRCLDNPNPPDKWRLEFQTPTSFHGQATHLPFPLPESLVGSWLRRWQAFAPKRFSKKFSGELIKRTRSHLAVSSYRMNTELGGRSLVGCLGILTLQALQMPVEMRAALDLLANYAFYCGSGSHTAQGMGQTRLLKASHSKKLAPAAEQD